MGFGGATGLDYVGVRVVADAIGIEWDGDLLLVVQGLEFAKLNEMERRRQVEEQQRKAQQR